ncbi:MAG: SusC/RagA family TonB-linked outer membrane protein [Prevotella sp.]|nr:SusC/RagA family TonB-linked outer membrane protein [Prevotella sp.]
MPIKKNIITLCLLTAVTNATAQSLPDSLSLKVGYGEASSKTSAGAIDKVTQERMNKGLITNSLDALNGQAAGVQIQSGGYQEAMLSAVRVRGTTSLTGGNNPLVIIDGVQSDVATLSTIYPADIESFTILKDASETAQYGSRGAAGVIEVATKKGHGGKFHISYDGSIGIEHAYKNMDMLNASQFRQAAARLGVAIVDKGYDTDFTQAPVRTGVVHNHHVAFGDGSATSNYRASVGIMDHQTVVKNLRLRNYIAKLDISQHAFDNRLTVDLGFFGSLQKNDYIPFVQKLFYSAATFNPTFPKGRNVSGGYDGVPEALWINNPYALLDIKDDDNNGHFNVHLKAKLNLGYGLTLRAFGSFSYNSIHSGHYYPTYVWNYGEAYRRYSKTETRLGNVSLNWKHDYGQHHLNLMALAEAESNKQKGFYTTVSNFTTDAYGYNNLSAGSIRPWGGTNSFYIDSHLASLLFRAQYDYKNRYTLNLSARADGSSKVGANNRWGFFPSVSGSWVVSDEPWMQATRHWLSKLKLRAGYGKSGNLGGIDSYLSRQLVKPNGVVSVDDTPTVTLGIIRNANPDLRWEIKRTFNVGMDMAFWDNRIVLTGDFYLSKTTDMLYSYDVPVPPFTYNTLLANLGQMRNHGFELGFGITPLRRHDMELNISMNWSFERNKLVTLNGQYNGQYLTAPDIKGISGMSGAGYHGGSDACFQIVGQPLGVFYLPRFLGFTTNENGGKLYNISKEKYICGQATPKATMGSNIAFRYRQWDVTVQVNGVFGHKIYNGTSLTYMNMLSLPNYNVMKGAPEMNIQDQDISDYWLESGDYVNIDYVTLGWNVPIRSKYIHQLRLSCSVNNLATITGYSGLTPIINSSVVDATLGVDDKRSYPVYRSYSIGLRIQF